MSGTLACHDISLSYAKGSPVVSEVSLTLTPGIWAVVGPNGAGKSTLLRALAGLHRPANGRVALHDQDLYKMSPKRRAASVAYVPQRSNVWAGFDVRTVVAMGRHALSRDDGAIDHALARVGLRNRASAAYRTLSVGQQQRVTFARALAQLEGSSNGVLIADEPLSAQDPAHVASIVGLMHGHARSGGIVVAAMHDCTTAMRCADGAVLLGGDGRLVSAGSAQNTLTAGALERVFGVRFDLVRSSGGVALLPAWIDPTSENG